MALKSQTLLNGLGNSLMLSFIGFWVCVWGVLPGACSFYVTIPSDLKTYNKLNNTTCRFHRNGQVGHRDWMYYAGARGDEEPQGIVTNGHVPWKSVTLEKQ